MSFFAGILAIALCVRRAGYSITAVLFSETLASCIRTILHHFPDAIDMGPMPQPDLTKARAAVQEWGGTFDLLLLDSGSPCQGFTSLSSGRLGMNDPRSGLFAAIPNCFQVVADMVIGLGVKVAFIQENVLMEPHWQACISDALGVIPLKLSASSFSVASRNRLVWTNTPFRPQHDEVREGHTDHIAVSFPGSPSPPSLPEGWHLNVAPGQSMCTLTSCRPYSSPPRGAARIAAQASTEAVSRWRADKYRYPPFAYEACNMVTGPGGELVTPWAAIREQLMDLPTGWTVPAGSEDDRCAAIGNSYQVSMNSQAIRDMDQVPTHSRRLSLLRPSPGHPQCYRRPGGPSPLPLDPTSGSWPEMTLRKATTMNEAILTRLPTRAAVLAAPHMPPAGLIEAIVAPYRDWMEAMQHSGRHTGAAIGPDLGVIAARAERAAAVGRQRGSDRSRVTVDNPVPAYLEKGAHMQAASAAIHPFHRRPPIEQDLRHSIELSAGWGRIAAAQREARIEAMRRVAECLLPAAKKARMAQSPRARQVAGEVNAPFIAFMIVLCLWPHDTLPARFLEGFSVMGPVEVTNRSGYKPATTTSDALLATAQEWHDQVFASPPPADAQDIYDATQKEIEKGFSDVLRDRSFYDRRFGPCGWRGCIRFGTWQGDKFRPIDDGKRSGHNAAQEVFEKIHHCPLEFFFLACKHFLEVLEKTQPAELPTWTSPRIAVCDLGDAYRGTPSDEDSCRWMIILLFDVALQRWRACEQWGHSYGFRSSVNNFNAYPELTVAFCRRFLAVATHHYVDDFPVFDHSGGGNSSHKALIEVFRCGGCATIAHEKTKPPATSNLFLGAVHDFSDLCSTGTAYLRTKPGRAEKIAEKCCQARRTRRLTPGAAAELRGALVFLASSIHGNLAGGGLQPLGEHIRTGRTEVDNRLAEALEFLETAALHAPPRAVQLRGHQPRMEAWSDAEYDQCKPEAGGGLGFLCQFDDRVVGFSCKVPPSFIEELLPKKQQIGQLEALVPLVALWTFPSLFKGRDILWGVDNTSAEAALIRGYSTKADTAPIVAATSILLAKHHCRPWWYHVDSASNPSDGLSRNGVQDPWTASQAAQHGWELHTVPFPPLHRLNSLPLSFMVQHFGPGYAEPP